MAEILPFPLCTGCGLTPAEIGEYAEMAGEGVTADEYVRREEGTYNPKNGHFLCSLCYIKFGMPTAPGGWKAP